MKVVIRLLDAAGTLLGWTQVQAKARGDGCLWSSGPVVLHAEANGVPACLSLHWCDVNVEVRVPLPEQARVAAGQALTVYPQAAPLITCGQPPVSLAPVTLRAPAAITVPVRDLGVMGTR